MAQRRTVLVKLLKGCVYGNAGEVVRLPYQEAIRACERSQARMHEWRPPQRNIRPDVTKSGPKPKYPIHFPTLDAGRSPCQ